MAHHPVSSSDNNYITNGCLFQPSEAFADSEQRGYPINDPIHHTCNRAIDDDRAGDCEHLGADAEDKALCLCSSRTQYSCQIGTIRRYNWNLKVYSI